MSRIYDHILNRSLKNEKAIAVLLDPDKVRIDTIKETLLTYSSFGVDYIFIGGSMLVSSEFEKTVALVKANCDIPVILFPGSAMQISKDADAILFLSLISGRNADLLIGQHVVAAPKIKSTNLETISTGYMLVDGGKKTTAHYISQTIPIPFDKPEIAACTAMAGEMLGLKLMYLDGGSGAKIPVSPKMISAVKKSTSTPLIVGGGIRNRASIDRAFDAGADIVVIGNYLEENPNGLDSLLSSITQTVIV